MTNFTDSNESFSNGVQWGWDSTSLKLAFECPRKYYYTMIEGWKPKKISVHLTFGLHYAWALENFYKRRAEGLSIDDALESIIHEVLIRTWDEEKGEPVAFEHAAKTRYTLIRSIIWYIEEFGDESNSGIKTHHLSNGKPAVELSFSFEVEPDIYFCGHLDRVVEFSGARFFMDQKTTGTTVGSYFFENFDLDAQMSMYTFAGQVILDSPVRGGIVDAAQIAVGFTRFTRGFTHRSQANLDEWLDTTIAQIRYIQQLSEIGSFPMNYTACGNYGGCAFRHVCKHAEGTRRSILESDFTQRLWDPIGQKR